jgi:transcriptional repressor NrdR
LISFLEKGDHLCYIRARSERDSQKSFYILNKSTTSESEEDANFGRSFMKCPFCNHEESKVTDSRDAVENNAIRRRRECCQCMRRFTTFETVDLSLQVKKRDGTFEDFQQEKLMHGMDSACRHTRVSHDQVRALTYKIKTDLMARGVREISSRELGEIVMQHLQETDVVAYIRFACVYKRFKDVRELLEAIQSIAPKEALKETDNEEITHAFEEK